MDLDLRPIKPYRFVALLDHFIGLINMANNFGPRSKAHQSPITLSNYFIRVFKFLPLSYHFVRLLR